VPIAQPHETDPHTAPWREGSAMSLEQAAAYALRDQGGVPSEIAHLVQQSPAAALDPLAQYDDARMLLANGDEEDRQTAESLLEEALSTARGQIAARERRAGPVAEAGEKHPDSSPASTVYPDGLTERELEVLRLIVAGKSNTEIAQQIVLSVRTVERHISNIYEKIGARGKVARAAATSYAFTHNLAPPSSSAEQTAGDTL